MIIHRCGEYECREQIPIKYRYCQKHWRARHNVYEEQKAEALKNKTRYSQSKQQRYDTYQRDDESRAFYHNKHWTKTRDYVYARDEGTCQVCGNIVNGRKIVDHIVALKLDRNKGLDTNNLWTLCYKCHSRKTRLEIKMIEDKKENTLKHLDTVWWKKILREKI